MLFERNLNGIDVLLRIENYQDPSKHEFGDWWCDCCFSFRMSKPTEIINYRKDHDELLTPEEVDGLGTALTDLLDGKIAEPQEYSMVEPDFVFMLYPIKDLRTDPKYTYVALRSPLQIRPADLGRIKLSGHLSLDKRPLFFLSRLYWCHQGTRRK